MDLTSWLLRKNDVQMLILTKKSQSSLMFVLLAYSGIRKTSAVLQALTTRGKTECFSSVAWQFLFEFVMTKVFSISFFPLLTISLCVLSVSLPLLSEQHLFKPLWHVVVIPLHRREKRRAFRVHLPNASKYYCCSSPTTAQRIGLESWHRTSVFPKVLTDLFFFCQRTFSDHMNFKIK